MANKRLLGSLATKRKLGHQDIERKKEEIKKRIRKRPENIKPFIPQNINKAKECCNRVLEFAKQEIQNGRIPIFLLPDTGMRISGMLFYSALSKAFPETYRPLRKLLLSPIIFLDVGATPGKPEDVKLPKVFKKIPNLTTIVIDDFGPREEYNPNHYSTIARIEIAIQRNLPKAKYFYNNMNDQHLNVVPAHDNLASSRIFDNQKIQYHGRGGMLKLSRYNSVYVKNNPKYPSRIVTRPKDYIEQGREDLYWNERDLKTLFLKLGTQLGTEFRTRLLQI